MTPRPMNIPRAARGRPACAPNADPARLVAEPDAKARARISAVSGQPNRLVVVDAADVLAGLDTVNWAGLTHAYGPASDVPGLIRALASTEADERARALHSLHGNIVHQGSRYEATACAVPFLARLAADPQIAQRDDIVFLLAALAIGYDRAFLPAGVDIAG